MRYYPLLRRLAAMLVLLCAGLAGSALAQGAVDTAGSGGVIAEQRDVLAGLTNKVDGLEEARFIVIDVVFIPS